MAAKSSTFPSAGDGNDIPPRPGSSGRVLIAGRCSETIYRQRRVLASFLLRAGWEVHLCGDRGDSRYIDALIAEGFTFHALDLDQKAKSPIAAMRLLLAYRRIVRTVRPDIVHTFNAKPTIIGLAGAALGGCRARIATVAGLGHLFMARSRFVRSAGQGAFRAALCFAHAVVFYNEDDCRAFVLGRLVTADKTGVIAGSGIDLVRFAPVGFPPDAPLEALFVGRLLLEKGIAEVIAAGRILRRQGAAVRITIVGDIDRHNPSSLDRATIEDAVEEGAVVWRGGLHDVAPAIAASHVVILPSHREGIPLALVEGGAMGRALIATDAPGCRDVVEHGCNGLLVPVGDAGALADALTRLADDRELLEKFGAEAARRARDRFGADAVSSQVAALYERIRQ